MRRHQALVESDHQVFAGLLGGVDHGLRVGARGGHGLFAKHMFAGVQRFDALAGVQCVRAADDDGVNVGILEHLLIIGISLRAILGGDGVDAFLDRVSDGRDLRVRIGGAFGDVAALGNCSAANDSITDGHVHVSLVSMNESAVWIRRSLRNCMNFVNDER